MMLCTGYKKIYNYLQAIALHNLSWIQHYLSLGGLISQFMNQELINYSFINTRAVGFLSADRFTPWKIFIQLIYCKPNFRKEQLDVFHYGEGVLWQCFCKSEVRGRGQ